MAGIVAEQADLEDSNIAGIGSEEDRALRKAAAASDENFKDAGTAPGLQIWRVENKRTDSDTPDFGIAHWPKEEYGHFYSGDSYLVLSTYKEKDSDALRWDVHYWQGVKSSQDEKGVSAYKAVELDDLLDDGPIQHRESMGHESGLFQTYFKDGIKYMEGGIASGFRHVKPEEYVPRLLKVKRTKRTTRGFEVPCKATSLNHGDVFILDAGREVTMWVGDSASPFEKAKAAAMVHNIVSARKGKAKQRRASYSSGDAEPEFWKLLDGTVDDVQPAEADQEKAVEDISASSCVLFRLSDADGALKFEQISESPLKLDMLDDADAFIVDAGIEIFAWIGAKASRNEKTHAMLRAQNYLDSRDDRPAHTPITRIKAGQINQVFLSCFA